MCIHWCVSRQRAVPFRRIVDYRNGIVLGRKCRSNIQNLSLDKKGHRSKGCNGKSSHLNFLVSVVV